MIICDAHWIFLHFVKDKVKLINDQIFKEQAFMVHSKIVFFLACSAFNLLSACGGGSGKNETTSGGNTPSGEVSSPTSAAKTSASTTASAAAAGVF